mmetsp:Transcript_16957/g.48061  ORF Transcript_16957/g.48061 Transcript_16957/m.48061 type:complete len:220 (-) Transcript_16957:40-699(-)
MASTCFCSWAMISRCRRMRDCSLLTSTGRAEHRTWPAFCAKRNVDMLWSTASSAGVIVTRMPVCELPPRCTDSKRVSFESRMGKWAAGASASCRACADSFSITLPRKKSDVLMELDSCIYSVPISMRSLPARSTITRRPICVMRASSSPAPSCSGPSSSGAPSSAPALVMARSVRSFSKRVLAEVMPARTPLASSPSALALPMRSFSAVLFSSKEAGGL